MSSSGLFDRTSLCASAAGISRGNCLPSGARRGCPIAGAYATSSRRQPCPGHPRTPGLRFRVPGRPTPGSRRLGPRQCFSSSSLRQPAAAEQERNRSEPICRHPPGRGLRAEAASGRRFFLQTGVRGLPALRGPLMGSKVSGDCYLLINSDLAVRPSEHQP
jgi:hypothetical protein